MHNSERVNMRADLQKWGVHQRDVEKDEEVQLSLEQVGAIEFAPCHCKPKN